MTSRWQERTGANSSSLHTALTINEIRFFLLISKEPDTEQCKLHHILLNKTFTERVEERLKEVLLQTLCCDNFSFFILKSTILVASFYDQTSTLKPNKKNNLLEWDYLHKWDFAEQELKQPTHVVFTGNFLQGNLQREAFCKCCAISLKRMGQTLSDAIQSSIVGISYSLRSSL